VRTRSFEFEGDQFCVDRGVFDPVRHLSGLAFAEQLADLIAEHGVDARTALDLGTGCGLLAATLARYGLRVVATDVSYAAVRCAAENCADLDVEVRYGDMFEPLQNDRFDLAVINPPYERSKPSWRTSAALTSPDFLEKLGAHVHEFASTVVIGFPVDNASELLATGLELSLWRTVKTEGRDLGLFVSTRTPSL